MKMRRLLCFSCFFIPLFCGTITVRAAESLIDTGSLSFMEEFALKLYNRGDVRQATKEFERIQRIDPTNKIAQEHLAKVGQKPLVEKFVGKPVARLASDITRISALSEDIDQLKKEIARQEKNTLVLKDTLRNSLAENDNLYSALDKRSREVMELREKLYATPYGAIYKELMGEFNTDRIPQRAFSSRAILPAETNSTVTEAPPITTARLTQEIKIDEIKLEELRTQGVYDPMKIAELEKVLDEKRAMLADKNNALTERMSTISSINTEVATINQELKTTDAAYAASAANLEQQYQTMKDSLAKTTASDQKIFVELLGDYIKNVKNLQEFRTAADERSKAMKELTATLKNNDALIQSLNDKILQKDKEIANYKQLLATASQELDAKTTVIREKEETLIQTAHELNTINSALANIQDLLASTDRSMLGLQAEINNMQAFIAAERQKNSVQKDAITALSEATSQRTSAVLDLKERLKALALPIQTGITTRTAQDASDMKTQEEKINAIADKLGAFTDQAQELHTIINTKDHDLTTLKELLLRSEKELAAQSLALNEREENILDLEEKLAARDRKMTYLSEIVSGKTSLNDAELKKVVALASALKKESSTLQDALAFKDDKIMDMNNYLVHQDQEIRKLRETTRGFEELKTLAQEKDKLTQENAALTDKLAEEKKNTLNTLEAHQDLKTARLSLAAISLDLQEKEVSLSALKDALNIKTTALDDAEKQVLTLAERLSALEFKQKAMRDIVSERDMEVASITRELTLAKNTLASMTEDAVELRARVKTLESALLIAQKKMVASEQDAAMLKEQADNLRKDLLNAQKIIQTRENTTGK